MDIDNKNRTNPVYKGQTGKYYTDEAIEAIKRNYFNMGYHHGKMNVIDMINNIRSKE